MGTRHAGDVYISEERQLVKASAQTTTSGGVTIISVNTTGASEFALTNFGSIAVYVTGSFDSEYALSSINMTNPQLSAAAQVVNVALASTGQTFEGPYQVVRVIANSGSGVYRANLTYR